MAHVMMWERFVAMPYGCMMWTVCEGGCEDHAPGERFNWRTLSDDEIASHCNANTHPLRLRMPGIPGCAINQMIRLMYSDHNAKGGIVTAKGCKPSQGAWEGKRGD